MKIFGWKTTMLLAMAAALAAAAMPAIAEQGVQTAVPAADGWSPIGFDLWPAETNAVYGLRLGLCCENRDVCGLSLGLLYNADETASAGIRLGGVNSSFQSHGSLDVALLSNVIFDERSVAGLKRNRVADVAADAGAHYWDVVGVCIALDLHLPDRHVDDLVSVPPLVQRMLDYGWGSPADWDRSGGLQVAALGANYGFCNYYGAQVALLGNYVVGDLVGLQVVAFRNYCGCSCYGGQVGIYNTAETLSGLQIGLVNEDRTCCGAQLGLVNICRELRGLQIGIANFAKSGRGVQIGIGNSFGERALPLINARF